MSKKNLLDDNPFLALKGFVKVAPEHARAADKQGKSDYQLFMDEVARLGRARDPEPGFMIAEICQLPEIKMAKKQTVKPENVARPEQPEEPEADIFLQAMGNALPLPKGSGRDIVPAPKMAPGPHQTAENFESLLEENLEFSLLFSDEYLEGHIAGLDERLMQRLRLGQMSPEAHLDLHGLNSMQAYEALRIFFRNAWFKGLRVVLLVPGRGLNSPNGQGILRKKIQTWLTQEPFKRAILAFCTARPHDGGAGSVYVLLRKHRKKGRIFWDRLPQDPDLY